MILKKSIKTHYVNKLKELCWKPIMTFSVYFILI